jgi:hypothetical protein
MKRRGENEGGKTISIITINIEMQAKNQIPDYNDAEKRCNKNRHSILCWQSKAPMNVN